MRFDERAVNLTARHFICENFLLISNFIKS